MEEGFWPTRTKARPGVTPRFLRARARRAAPSRIWAAMGWPARTWGGGGQEAREAVLLTGEAEHVLDGAGEGLDDGEAHRFQAALEGDAAQGEAAHGGDERREGAQAQRHAGAVDGAGAAE